MEDDEFYDLIITRMDGVEDQLSALEKILKAFRSIEVADREEVDTIGNTNST